MERIIDLHIHTDRSDGAYSPKEIIDMAKKNGVTTIAIADHDTVEAYTDELFNYAEEQGVELIPAVEMSTRYYGVGLHVLGYNMDLNNSQLLDCLKMLKNARVDYLFNVAEKLAELGYKLNVDELKNLPTVTKAHISQEVVSNEENKDLLIKVFGYVPARGEFIETIMNEGCPAFVEKFSITPIEASRIIKEAGGIVVLAHPVAYMHEDNLTVEQIENVVKLMNADGIEADYLYADKNNEVFNETEFWKNFAKENSLITTVGSDFHNYDGVHPELGFVNMEFKLTSEEIDKILNNLRKKH